MFLRAIAGLTWRPQPCPEEQAFAAMHAALETGCTFWNGGEFYGTPAYNSMTVMERYFARYPEDADKVLLSMKGAINRAAHKPDGSPESVRRSLDGMIDQLRGRKKVDIFECARRDPNVPLEVTMRVLEEYIAEGKLGAISLSEVSAATIHEAVKITKVTCVEVELSLWATEVLTNGVAEACAKYGITLVAYSPLGRGILTGQIKSIDDLPVGDFRRNYPRFQPDTFPINLQLVEQIEALAKKKGCTPSQLAIGWCIAMGRRPGMPIIIPIPGATTEERVRENSVVVDLSDEEMAEIDETLAKFKVVGGRYPPNAPVYT